jgi:cytoskeletal protein CcmA (bactofilin family)
MDTGRTGEFAHIGKSVIIKGELSGSEDLTVDGTVEGTIHLQGNSLVIGPNGQVKAGIQAKNVMVQGKVEGDIRAAERTELRKSAVVMGDIFTHRLAIEEGAFLKGKVDVQREAAKPAPSPVAKSEPHEAKAPAVATSVAGAGAATSAAGTPVTKS